MTCDYSKLPPITSAFQDPFICSNSILVPGTECVAACHVVGPGLIQNWSAGCSENGNFVIPWTTGCAELTFDHNGVGYLPRNETMPWPGAVQTAYQFTYKGQHGQLPLVTDKATNDLICHIAPGQVVYTAGIANDLPSAINFFWAAAPMRGVKFYHGFWLNGSVVNGSYTNFMPTQPNSIDGCVFINCQVPQKYWFVIHFNELLTILIN
jgi:hypothetical protein